MKKYEDEIDMMKLLHAITPLERTLASDDTDKALKIVKDYLPTGIIEGYETGKAIWSWFVPPRFEVQSATIKVNGQILVDVKDHPLHLVNYSRPFKGRVSHDELMKHLHSDPQSPHAIPFVFRFYQDTWGFCIPENWRSKFTSDFYDIEVNTTLDPGKMNVFYDFLPGDNKETFVISSNICHPTQVNDSLTGVAVGADIMARLRKMKKRKYSYLFMVVPEQVGSVGFFAHHENLIPQCVGGFFSEMLGTPGPIVAQRTRNNSYLDFLIEENLKRSNVAYKVVPFLKSAANDEKVLDSPGVNVPTFSFTRSPYIQYHTSDDNMDLIQLEKLQESRDVLQEIIFDLENDFVPKLKYPGPVFLSGHGLYPDYREDPTLLPMWLSFIDIMYALDNKLSVIEVAKKINCDPSHVFYWCNKFIEKSLMTKEDHKLKKES